MLFEAFVIGRGVFVLRNPQRADGHRRSWNGMLLFFTVLLIGCALSIVLIETRGYTSVNTSAESYMPVSASVDKGVNWSDIKINYVIIGLGIFVVIIFTSVILRGGKKNK